MTGMLRLEYIKEGCILWVKSPCTPWLEVIVDAD